MGWIKFTRDDTYEGADAPFVAVSSSRFAFSAVFARLAEIDGSYRVTVYADERDRKLGFEFHKDTRPDSFPLIAYRTPAGASTKRGLTSSSQGILRKYAWAAAVTRQATKNRRFIPRKEGNLWVIQLCPAFEIRKARESADIPADHAGIYRYLRESGEVVYIGRGNIKSRLAAPGRDEWTFEIIEYSVVADPDEQVKWEDYWIARFIKEHAGQRPIYNKISGSAEHRDTQI